MSQTLKSFKIMEEQHPLPGSADSSRKTGAPGLRRIREIIEQTRLKQRKRLGVVAEVDIGEIEVMIDQIDASGSTIRLLVSEALRRWTIEALLPLTLDDDVIVRTSAAREIQTRGGETAFLWAKNLLGSDKEATREIGAFVLGQFGTPETPYKEESIPLLVQLTFDPSPDVRAATSAALGHLCHLGMPAQVERELFRLASDSESSVRACVAYALGNASSIDQARVHLDMLSQDPSTMVREYAELGRSILENTELH